jgi:hypothetical protein
MGFTRILGLRKNSIIFKSRMNQLSRQIFNPFHHGIFWKFRVPETDFAARNSHIAPFTFLVATYDPG